MASCINISLILATLLTQVIILRYSLYLICYKATSCIIYKFIQLDMWNILCKIFLFRMCYWFLSKNNFVISKKGILSCKSLYKETWKVNRIDISESFKKYKSRFHLICEKDHMLKRKLKRSNTFWKMNFVDFVLCFIKSYTNLKNQF